VGDQVILAKIGQQARAQHGRQMIPAIPLHEHNRHERARRWFSQAIAPSCPSFRCPRKAASDLGCCPPSPVRIAPAFALIATSKERPTANRKEIDNVTEECALPIGHHQYGQKRHRDRAWFLKRAAGPSAKR